MLFLGSTLANGQLDSCFYESCLLYLLPLEDWALSDRGIYLLSGSFYSLLLWIAQQSMRYCSRHTHVLNNHVFVIFMINPVTVKNLLNFIWTRIWCHRFAWDSWFLQVSIPQLSLTLFLFSIWFGNGSLHIVFVDLTMTRILSRIESCFSCICVVLDFPIQGIAPH